MYLQSGSLRPVTFVVTESQFEKKFLENNNCILIEHVQKRTKEVLLNLREAILTSMGSLCPLSPRTAPNLVLVDYVTFFLAKNEYFLIL